jgi:hypothetical protein
MIPMKVEDSAGDHCDLLKLSILEPYPPRLFLTLPAVVLSNQVLAKNNYVAHTQSDPNRHRDGLQVLKYRLSVNHHDILKVPQTFRLGSTDS